jgi:hypothetical protein
MVVSNAMEAGWPFNDPSPLLDSEGNPTADGLRAEAALEEVVEELFRRGGTPEPILQPESEER